MLTRSFRRVDEDEEDSWCVRYYALSELRELMTLRFADYDYRAHCFFGTGILPDDLRHVPMRFIPLILGSMGLTALAQVFPPMKRLADSVYVHGVKPYASARAQEIAIQESGQRSNLDILPLLRCPVDGTPLQFNPRRNLLVSNSGREYPVVDDIPVLLPD
jgi:hypothetical protein